MAQPTNTFATNDMVGIREDLIDVIYDISPTETPFLNRAPRVAIPQVLHEWQTDTLAAAADNKHVEGDDATTDASVATVRLNNRTQIADKVARVTGTGRAVNTAGRGDELDYQMLKRGRELRRDVEKALLDNNAKVTGTDATPGEVAGVPSWIATNTDAGSGGSDPAGTGADARTDGTQRAFTEDQLKTVARLAWDEGGEPDTLMLGAFNRQIASTFGAGTKVQQMRDDTLRASFSVYESDFGNLMIIPNRFQRARDGLVLDMDMWAVGFVPGREFATWDLAKTGDTDRRQILTEFSLQCNNEKAHGIVADLTTS